MVYANGRPKKGDGQSALQLRGACVVGEKRKKWQAYLDSTIDIPTEPEYYQALDWMALRSARALLLRRIVTISPFSSSSACLKQPPPPLLQAAAQQETGSIIVVPHPAPTSQAAPSVAFLSRV